MKTCKSCIHKPACAAWIRHGKTLYDDFEYNVENCPYYAKAHGRIIQTIKNGKMNRVFSCCGTDFTQLTMWITPNYCPNCGAKMEENITI